MRSSIACSRCRRSKVKCVNTGPNTTCRACESSNRECTYPQPVLAGTPRAAASSGMAVGPVGLGAGMGGSIDRPEAPKKNKPKKATSSSTGVTAASMNTPQVWRDCLSASFLTQAVWQSIFDAFQLHHSPLLPFLHPPTFLNRLRASASVGSSTGTSPPPEKPHSPLLLLGMLALTSRHVPIIISQHHMVLTTPAAVSEFYASALKHRLRGDDEDSILVPAWDKVQALLMLAVHEWGQTRKVEAYIWLGTAIRMGATLGLSWVDSDEAPVSAPYSPEPEPEEPMPFKRRKLDNGTPAKAVTAYAVEKEVRRRTFWAVFNLDRALSSGRYYPIGVPSEDANRVQLPSDERGFMFGADTKTGYLNSESLLNSESTSEEQDIGSGERILAHIIKAMEIWGRIQAWTEISDLPPTSPDSTYWKLSSALDAFVDSLPPQLEYSTNTLQVHFSTRSSSSYAVLHVTLFLARITLERKTLPDLPFLSARPVGPTDQPSGLASAEDERFYLEAAERYMASSRDLVALVTLLEEWNVNVESPFIISALERAARTGLYAYNFPWMDVRGYMTGVSRVPDAEPMGNGEETRKAIDFITGLKPRWQLAKDSYDRLVDMQVTVTEHIEKHIQHAPDGKELEDRLSKIVPNQSEKNHLFALLVPPPKPTTSVVTAHGRGPSSEVDTLLLAASGVAPEPAVASGTDRWMAVNTPAAAVQQQQQQQQQQSQSAPAPKSEEGGSLDALAGFAAQQGKIENSKDGYNARDVEMGEAGVKKEEVHKEESRPRGWADASTGPVTAAGANWGGVVNALES